MTSPPAWGCTEQDDTHFDLARASGGDDGAGENEDVEKMGQVMGRLIGAVQPPEAAFVRPPGAVAAQDRFRPVDPRMDREVERRQPPQRRLDRDYEKQRPAGMDPGMDRERRDPAASAVLSGHHRRRLQQVVRHEMLRREIEDERGERQGGDVRSESKIHGTRATVWATGFFLWFWLTKG